MMRNDLVFDGRVSGGTDVGGNDRPVIVWDAEEVFLYDAAGVVDMTDPTGVSQCNLKTQSSNMFKNTFTKQLHII